MIICYAVPEIWRVTDVTVIFHFGLVFALKQLKKIKILKKFKKGLEISSFYIQFQKYGEQWTDGQTEKVSYRGGCPT